MSGRIGKLLKHLRTGTIGDALKHKFGRMPQHEEVHWHGADSVDEAASALARSGQLALQKRGADGWIAVAGTAALAAATASQLVKLGVRHRMLSKSVLLVLPTQEIANLRMILCGDQSAADITALGAALLKHAALSRVPFEYSAGLEPERAVFQRLDEYRDTYFVSPLLSDGVPVYSIYEESLKHFEQKCGLRDYLDLCQLLRQLHVQDVPGAICEFGSFRGHSGWLIANVLKALGSDKELYLFDTFDKFPQEPYGVDEFWSQTHSVDFGEVRGKFSGLDKVRFVRGDFTQTLTTDGPTQIALAYVDCDSYRATRALIEQIWNARLPRGGLMVFEDYGHPALLGNRLAVNESLRAKPMGFQFFSQFSGLYVALKTSGSV